MSTWASESTAAPSSTDTLSSSLPSIDESRRASLPALWWLPIAFVAIGVLAFPVDLTIARWFHQTPMPRTIGELLNNAEPFGHGMGVAFIVATIVALDHHRRWVGLAVTYAALAGGMTANVIKMLVTRTRPRNFDLTAADTASTFGDWLPLLSHGSAGQSFPSGHTATAAALAVILSAAYPRGTWWFATLAVLVAGHRLHSSAHYLSDVGFGAAIGVAGGYLVSRAYRQRFAAGTGNASEAIHGVNVGHSLQ